MIIGYQGEIGSNAEEAAKQFAEKIFSDKILAEKDIKRKEPEEFHRIARKDDIDFLPLVNSLPVLEALLAGTIDYGVCAVSNSLAGEVTETRDALKKLTKQEQTQGDAQQSEEKQLSVKAIDTLELPIHHCLFCLTEKSASDLQRIASHEQALQQTVHYRNRYFPSVERIETKDTALAARELAQKILPDTCGVICRKNAGENYGLKLIAENIEDVRDNRTTFALFANPLRVRQ